MLAFVLPYSLKYWWELNLAVEPNITITRILADLNLAVRYRIAICIPYPHERGTMGGAPYIGPRLGDGPIFEVSMLHLHANVKELPGKLPTLSS